jgi:hypothetical protein
MMTANGETMAVTHIGFAKHFGRIMVCPALNKFINNGTQAKAYNNNNNKMPDLTEEDSDSDNKEETILYDNQASLTGANFNNTTTAAPVTNTQTAVQVTYTREQRSRAEQVRQLHDQMHCSDAALKLALIIGTGLTAQDVDVYRDIYGPCFACMAGKVTKPSYKQDSTTPPASRVGQTVHCDLLSFTESIIGGYFVQLFSVDEWTANKHLTRIKNKRIPSIHLAFCDLISYYQNNSD